MSATEATGDLRAVYCERLPHLPVAAGYGSQDGSHVHEYQEPNGGHDTIRCHGRLRRMRSAV